LLLFYIKAQEVEGKEEERKRRSTNDIYSSISFHISVAMCLILLAHQVVPDLPLLVLANRDEFIDRIVEPLQVWSNNHGENNNSEDLVAGMDRWKGNDNGNTYLAMHRKNGRFAAVVHVRQLVPPPSPHGDKIANGHTNAGGSTGGAAAAAGVGGGGGSTTSTTPGHSRGRLVVDFCTNDEEPIATYHENVLTPSDKHYDPYGMIYGSVEHGFYYYTNCESSEMKSTKLQPGIIYGLSNGALDAAWPKVRRGKELLRQTLDHWQQRHQDQQHQQAEDQEEQQPQREPQDGGISDDDLFAILKDDWRPPEDDDQDDAANAGDGNENNRLPDTGVGKITERFLSSIFIPSYFYDYGTIASTVVRVHQDGNVRIVERTYRHDDESEYTYVAEQSFRL
jgi:uncharacterized protein with NRDE domain